jgi:hypothetical protein
MKVCEPKDLFLREKRDTVNVDTGGMRNPDEKLPQASICGH